jgi:hypothetical protein
VFRFQDAPPAPSAGAAQSGHRQLAGAGLGFPLGTVVKVTRRDDDPLGYEGGVVARVCAMARDAVAGVNEVAVEEEAGVLRNRLRLKPLRADDAADPRR